jgi:hypothetical protein
MLPPPENTAPVPPALTPEEWQARDVRLHAAAVDAWARQSVDRQATDDPTQFVAKLGLTTGGEGVLVMSRAHDVVVVPPPARHTLAALALFDQPYGFTPADLARLHRAAAWAARLAQPGAEGEGARPGAEEAAEAAAVLRRVAARVEALLPPAAPA